uniref:Uncharacterized protein n=1 Tax=Proteus mirabilis TaxID=584 RepID=A0A346FVQ2_PROMI|nr:Hypothetical protein [Proteus mirabilis]
MEKSSTKQVLSELTTTNGLLSTLSELLNKLKSTSVISVL